uniref:Uncharacterized protein n=1 Tax=Setaria digitata TaxID=48799 RepID=A0A915PHU1_9BILA
MNNKRNRLIGVMFVSSNQNGEATYRKAQREQPPTDSQRTPPSYEKINSRKTECLQDDSGNSATGNPYQETVSSTFSTSPDLAPRVHV